MSVKLKQSLSSLASFFRRSNRSEDEYIQQASPVPPTNTESLLNPKDRLLTALPKYRKSLPYEWIQASAAPATHAQTPPTLEDHLRDLSVRTSESSSSTATTATATLWRDSSDLDHSMFPDSDRRPPSKKHHPQSVVAILHPPPTTPTMDIKQLLPASEPELPPSNTVSCECEERSRTMMMMMMINPCRVPLPTPLPPKPPKKKKSVLRTTSLGSFASSNDTLFHASNTSSKRVRFQSRRASLRSVTSTTLRRVRKSVLGLRDQFWKPHDDDERMNNTHIDEDDEEDDVNPLKSSKFNKTQPHSVEAGLTRSSTVRIGSKSKGDKEYGYDMAVRRARMGGAVHGMV
ncbi:hypothetical protein HDU85_005853 [Gaertneriomyces sp. JEL0708]|nr:hypothetical protein HDU85_005853 [Gaertneriomyces sp. JEL0708]